MNREMINKCQRIIVNRLTTVTHYCIALSRKPLNMLVLLASSLVSASWRGKNNCHIESSDLNAYFFLD